MFTFYRNAVVAILILLLMTALIMYVGVARSNLSVSLFPNRDADLLWAPAIEPTPRVDKTFLNVKSEVGTIDYEFFLDPDAQFPYTHYSFYFIEPEQPYKLVDLTRYSNVSFKILCDPKNVLLFVLFSYDEKVTNLIRPVTRRVSSTAFSCDNQWNTVTIGFDELDTPHWWLDRYGYEFSDRGYQLNKTMGFALVNSLQSPLNTLSRVRVTDVKVRGREESYIYAAGAVSILLWGLFLVGFFRQYVVVLTTEIREKVRRDQPLMAYKKLSIEPQKDKEKSTLLRYMATEYANADISLESAATTLGINRTKINELLKEELGLTFIAYLNKLRLTEAARLLSENDDANVSEIAYLVGYNNASYFNKLFKMEYGCTPKTFKTLYQIKEKP
jgi:AraC-like DNA-binding protein